MTARQRTWIAGVILVLTCSGAGALWQELRERRVAWQSLQSAAGQAAGRSSETARRETDILSLRQKMATLVQRGWLGGQPPDGWRQFFEEQARHQAIRVMASEITPSATKADTHWHRLRIEADVLHENTLIEWLADTTENGPQLNQIEACTLSRSRDLADPLLPLHARCEFLVWQP